MSGSTGDRTEPEHELDEALARHVVVLGPAPCPRATSADVGVGTSATQLRRIRVLGPPC